MVLAFDDSGNTFPLNPKAIVAFELQRQADGGGGLAAAARAPIWSSASGRWCRSRRSRQYPLTLAIPAKFGLQPQRLLRGSRTAATAFGYFDLGGILSVPLAFMNRQDATWELHGGLDILWLGENMKALNGGDGVKAGGHHRFQRDLSDARPMRTIGGPGWPDAVVGALADRMAGGDVADGK